MGIQAKLERHRERHERARGWQPQDIAENRLFDACCEVLESARGLEQMAGAPKSARATMPSVGCLSAALESLANASLMMRQAATDAHSPAREQLEGGDVGERLLAASLNLRLAARACELEDGSATPING